MSQIRRGVYSWLDVVRLAHGQGALVFVAHPFSPDYQRPDEFWDAIDGVEVFNARVEHARVKDANMRALVKAGKGNRAVEGGESADNGKANEGFMAVGCVETTYCGVPAAGGKQAEGGMARSCGSDAHFSGEVGCAYWECDIDVEGKTHDEVLLEVRNALASGQGTLRPGKASPFYRCGSQWVGAWKQKRYKKILKIPARFLYGLYTLTFGRRKGDYCVFL
jgi:predicted metal-dependent phosphoesterase TrpH